MSQSHDPLPYPSTSLQDGRPLLNNWISLYVSSAKVPIADSKQYVATVVAWIMLCQASCLYFPYTMSKTSVTTLGSRGHLQPVCRCNISLNLTEFWENISHVYGTTSTITHQAIHSYVSPCIKISAGARSRWQSLLTIFTALFGAPRALAHSFFTSPAPHPLYLQFTLPISTAAALNTSPNYFHFGPF